MSKLVVGTANLKCSMGMSPSSLTVLPDKNADCDNQAIATIQDQKPNVNIMPFGMCQSMANPQVAAATAAAQGTLTPQPCLPVIPAPWSPGSPTTSVANQPALTDDSKCTCQWAGVIEVAEPGQRKTELG